MVRFASIEPAVAAYALLKTKMEGVARATDFIFDRRRGNGGPSQMHHPFVGVESALQDENPSEGFLGRSLSFISRASS